MLKGLRRDIARRQGIPPYLVFMDPSLESMATLYPMTKEDLLGVPGVGSGKAMRYGKPFLDLIKRYVEENDIIPPADYRIKSVANKNNRKISIIQAIDRRIDLEEVCEGMGLEFGEFLDELEAIVEAGTKIDIDYFISEIFDEDQVEDMLEWFRTSEDGTAEGAIQALGAEYDEEDIRLIRVKFISDIGN